MPCVRCAVYLGALELYQACEEGQLEKVRSQLSKMPDAINEFIRDGKNLLMW